MVDSRLAAFLSAWPWLPAKSGCHNRQQETDIYERSLLLPNTVKLRGAAAPLSSVRITFLGFFDSLSNGKQDSCHPATRMFQKHFLRTMALRNPRAQKQCGI
jgi:hypothetical protein